MNVIGVGMVKFQKPGASDEYNVMAANAIRNAMKDCGVEFNEIPTPRRERSSPRQLGTPVGTIWERLMAGGAS